MPETTDWRKLGELLAQWLLSLLKPKPGPGPAPKPDPEPSPPPPTPEPQGDSAKLLALHNQARSQRGLAPLAVDARLTSAAQKHSNWMQANRKMTHDENGAPFTDRLRAAGYPYGHAGENIAAGQQSAEQVFNAWMNSAGHRQNILNGNFRDVGFGRAGNYWTTNFGTVRMGMTEPTLETVITGAVAGDVSLYPPGTVFLSGPLADEGTDDGRVSDPDPPVS